jgi:hypothetical protein
MSGTDPVSSLFPLTPPPPSANESGRENLQHRATIAERIAKLGGIRLGAPPPVTCVQPFGPPQSKEDAGTEGSAPGSGHHTDDIRDIVQGKREEILRQLQAKREEARTAQKVLEQQVLAEHARADKEWNTRVRELNEELVCVCRPSEKMYTGGQ